MKEVIEFRIPEVSASAVLSPEDGVVIGGSVRKLELTLPDDRLALIRDADAPWRARGSAFFTSWQLSRTYSAKELDAADAFLLKVSRVFEPAAEECGTVYEDSSACDLCGSGARRVGPLWLPLRSIPKSVDVARTIAGELVVSQRFAEVAIDASLTGFELRLVRDGRADPGEAARLEKVEHDPRLVAAAVSAGIKPGSSGYFVWIGGQAQEPLVAEVVRDVGAGSRRHSSARAWYELVVPQTVDVSSATEFGENPFSDPDVRPDRCPLGHVLGLNRLTELSVIGGPWEDVDLAATRQFVGVRRGLLRPEPMLVASQRFHAVIEQERLRGFSVEVVHVVSS